MNETFFNVVEIDVIAAVYFQDIFLKLKISQGLVRCLQAL